MKRAPPGIPGGEKIFEKPRKKCLTISGVRANISKSSRARHNIRVWRSLVSRLNGVQEAAGSNPVTRTKREEAFIVSSLFIWSEPRTSGLLRADRRISIRRMEMPREAQHFPLVRIQSLGPRKPLISKEMSGFSAFIHCFWLTVIFRIYHFSTTSPDYAAPNLAAMESAMLVFLAVSRWA